MSTYVFNIFRKNAYNIVEVIMLSDIYLSSKAVGEAICACRKNKNVSQEVLSGLADIGRTHLSAIERGERKPTLETLYRISMALNMKMSDVVKEIEQRL